MKTTEKLFVTFCLIVTAVITVATSSKKDSSSSDTTYANFGVASDCPDSVTNQSITASSSGSITSPTDVTFRSFGFPVNMVVIATDTTVTGILNGVERTCTYSRDTTNGLLHVYSCTDNGVSVCRITFTPL